MIRMKFNSSVTARILRIEGWEQLDFPAMPRFQRPTRTPAGCEGLWNVPDFTHAAESQKLIARVEAAGATWVVRPDDGEEGFICEISDFGKVFAGEGEFSTEAIAAAFVLWAETKIWNER